MGFRDGTNLETMRYSMVYSRQLIPRHMTTVHGQLVLQLRHQQQHLARNAGAAANGSTRRQPDD